MQNPLKEQTILVLSIIKWTILASLVGGITGLITTLFLKTLNLSSSYLHHFSLYFLLLPLLLFISQWLTHYLPKDIQGQGKVIEAVHQNKKISILVVPIRFVATILTLAGGGSAGKVGPCAQMGAGAASSMSGILKLKQDDRRKLIICGISAGFSTVFGTPIAGAIFAIEVLVLGRVLNNYLFPVLISSLVGYKVTEFFHISYHHYLIVLPFKENILIYLQVALSGILFGLIALILIETLALGNKLTNKIKIKSLKGFIGGGLIIIMVFLFHSTTYLGLGTSTINASIHGSSLPLYTFLIKILFVAITLSFGGSGGVITPIFFVGTTAGIAFAQIFHLDLSFFAAIGLVSLLSGSTNTPIASTFMAVELFGISILPYAALACIISYIIAGHRGIYPTQIIGAAKSNALPVEHNIPVEEVMNT